MTTLYNVYSEKEMKPGFCDLALVPILAKNPTIKYSYLIEIKYIKPSDLEKENHDDKLQVLGAEAETQLNRYGSDKKFLESIGNTTLKKLVLIFSGNRLVHYYEI
jgi:hypothetical protein